MINFIFTFPSTKKTFAIKFTLWLKSKITNEGKGLRKLILNEEAIKQDLDKNWAVVAEAIQTVLRREGYANPYETLKELTRKNETISATSIAEFIDGLEVNDTVKQELKKISPHNYTGI